MADAEGTFRFEKDTRKYQRFEIRLENGGVGTLYLPKDVSPLPKKIMIRYRDKDHG